MSINRKADENISKTNTRKTTKRMAAFTVAVAAALFTTACGAGSDAAPADEPVQTLTSEAPVTDDATAESGDDEATLQSESGESSADDGADEASEDDSSDEEATDEPTPASIGECSDDQMQTFAFASVINIDPDDADGGLNVRDMPGTSGAKVGILPAGTVVETSFHSDVRCATVDGDVWWYVYGPDVQGWVHTGFLSEQIDEFPEEEDASFDCEPLSNGECVVLIYVPGGEIIFDGTPDEDTIAWAQLGCVYEGSDSLCTALASIDRQDPGNGFAQAPTAALETDCAAGDPTTDPLVAFACAELATRS